MISTRHISVFLALLLLSFCWVSTDVSAPNERSRIYLATSLVDHQTVTIDEAVERFGSIYDRAQREGKTYSDKAPGSSLFGAAVYGVSRLFTDADDWTIEALLLLMRFGLMIPLTVLGLWLLRRLLRNLGLDPPVVDMASIGWLVATPVLHYGQAFYGHQIVAVALLGAVVCLLEPNRKTWHLAVAGTCAGIAGMAEYQALLPCVILAIWVLTGESRKKPAELVAFFTAAAPFAVLLLGYHHLAFGGPFELSYHHLEDPSLDARHTEGIGGVAWPTWEAFWGGLFSLHRGLFATAPIVVFALAGIKPMIAAVGRRQTGFIAAILIYFALFIASSNTWYAGWSYGPRLLVSTLSVAAIPMAFGLARVRDNILWAGLAGGAFAVGLVSNLAMKLTFFEAPPSSTNPLMDVALPSITAGQSAPSLATTAGLAPTIGLVIAALLAAALFIKLLWSYASNQWMRVTALAIMTALLFLTMIYAAGPSWDDDQSERFANIADRILVQ